jgi:eukaryotic-like serine/threonine-protein kinase
MPRVRDAPGVNHWSTVPLVRCDSLTQNGSPAMANDSLLILTNTLIAGRFAVDTSQQLVDAGGGLPAYLARDRMAADGRRVALAVARDASPRAKHLKILDEPIDDLLVPLGHGVAPLSGGKGAGYFVICALPPGPPVSAALAPWPEKALMDLVLGPIAAALNALHNLRLTHRSIRPNNVFQSAPGQPVTLGAAWAAPPAMHQPSAFESPYTAICRRTTRGDGSIADDVYALGVLLLSLFGGKVPMANMDDATVVRWKLDLGSFAALTRDFSPSGLIADLVRVMLAEDPDHRPLPAELMDHASTRGRRVAARPGRRSQIPLMLNDLAVFDARTLAHGLFTDEKKAIQFLRNGLVTQWLRRGLGDADLATQIEDLVRGRLADTNSGSWSDPLLVMRTISALNPHMPLCWRGVALWPDALPSMLSEGIASNGELLAAAEELLAAEIFSSWSPAETRLRRPDSPELMLQRQLLQGGGPGGLLRLCYGLNPLLPCRAPGMAAEWISSVPDLMRFIERAAATAGDTLIDLHISTFIAAHADRKIEMQVSGLATIRDADSFRLAELALLRDLQARYHPSSMPGLAKWVATRLLPDLERWRNKPKREATRMRLDALVSTGSVSRLLELVEDRAAWALDSAAARRAANELELIDAEVAAIDSDDRARFADAERFGRAIAGGIGLSVFILMVMSVLLQ